MRWMVVWVALAGAALAEGERAGDFDYYVMALTWTPNFCDLEGDAKGRDQCAPGQGHGWLLHGLWPQYETGWPSYCRTSKRDPSRGQTAGMADIMGSAGLAWYEWKKHGRCSGLSSEAYFTASRDAYESVVRPEVFRKLDETVALPASVVEEAWLEANPSLVPDMVTVTCKAGRIAEARICLTKALEPRACGPDVVKDCTLNDALLAPLR
ncbi:ribonuclease T2 [Tropicimonas sp. IMCC6043]|uniref:ribonuclease T2 family protein n=1 Tax=Tropicimonas sp. IMCC6043 TaxID=2510645 RepID=UPI00101D0F16|nr:ribonuclease T2 [Tropicimonas sp. IMCC6043]RYH08185.1 ribonuclease T [Tropicimonas sp. IMCC6043]